MRKEQLTCISIERSGTFSGEYGTLIRFIVKFKEGLEGEYWGKSDASRSNFPIDKLHWYKIENLTKRDRPDTLKFYPCKTSEIPPVSDIGPNVASQMRPTQPSSIEQMNEPLARVSGAQRQPEIPVHILAFRAAVSLVASGRVDIVQIEPVALQLKKLLIELGQQGQ
jgi:hypothetical protein